MEKGSHLLRCCPLVSTSRAIGKTNRLEVAAMATCSVNCVSSYSRSSAVSPICICSSALCRYVDRPRHLDQVCECVCVKSLSDPGLFAQAVVVQQDSFIEEQRQALSERSSSSCSSLSRAGSRPGSLIEQEKQRSLEKQRQELALLQRQQTAHAEQRRRREKEWELREQDLAEREGLLHIQVPEHLPAAALGPKGLKRYFNTGWD